AARNDSDIDFRLAEACRLRGDNDVAAHGQLAATTQSVAADSSNHRLRDFVHATSRCEPPADRFVERPGVSHFFNVRAGGENFLSAGQDNDPHIVISVEGFHRETEIFDQAIGKGIQLLWTVQGDYGDGVVFLDDDVFKLHTVSNNYTYTT